MGKISVIVPIYKVEKYLEECLDSIIGQSYTNLEIILVDDGSPDGCPAICDRYAEQDERIIVIHQENQGVSVARNAGLDICTGEYIFFIDSDDTIELNALEILHKLLVDHDATMSVGNMRTVSEIKKPEIAISHDETQVKTLRQPEIMENYGEFMTDGIVWGKLYRAEVFEELRFPVGMIHEDNYLFPEICLKCSAITITTTKIYNYLQRNESIMGKSRNNRSLDTVLAKRRIYDILYQNNFDGAAQKAKFVILVTLMQCYDSADLKNEENRKRYLQYKVEFLDILKTSEKRGIPLKHKVLYAFYQINPYLCWIIFKATKKL